MKTEFIKEYSLLYLPVKEILQEVNVEAFPGNEICTVVKINPPSRFCSNYE